MFFSYLTTSNNFDLFFFFFFARGKYNENKNIKGKYAQRMLCTHGVYKKIKRNKRENFLTLIASLKKIKESLIYKLLCCVCVH